MNIDCRTNTNNCLLFTLLTLCLAATPAQATSVLVASGDNTAAKPMSHPA